MSKTKIVYKYIKLTPEDIKNMNEMIMEAIKDKTYYEKIRDDIHYPLSQLDCFQNAMTYFPENSEERNKLFIIILILILLQVYNIIFKW